MLSVRNTRPGASRAARVVQLFALQGGDQDNDAAVVLVKAVVRRSRFAQRYLKKSAKGSWSNRSSGLTSRTSIETG